MIFLLTFRVETHCFLRRGQFFLNLSAGQMTILEVKSQIWALEAIRRPLLGSKAHSGPLKPKFLRKNGQFRAAEDSNQGYWELTVRIS